MTILPKKHMPPSETMSLPPTVKGVIVGIVERWSHTRCTPLPGGFAASENGSAGLWLAMARIVAARGAP
jgi:hypothetical protein